MLAVAPKVKRSAIIGVLVLCMIATLFGLRSPSSQPSYSPTIIFGKQIDWSRFAYTQYVTNKEYLCNSIMLFETLHRLGSKADRLLMYPSHFSIVDSDNSIESRLLRLGRDIYGVKLKPIQIQRRKGADMTWAESFTKLLAFNQTEYDRVLSLDSDSTVLQTMDELFLLPPCPVAMPRAYWLNQSDRILSSQVILIQPSHFEFNRIMEAVMTASGNDYDMEIVNNIYRDSATILPHRPYDLLTGEFRGKNHESYLGNPLEVWDPARILNETKFLHFSDWPVPKPWIDAEHKIIEEKQPTCDFDPQTGAQDDCRARDLWNGIYNNFKERRHVRVSWHYREPSSDHKQNICDIAAANLDNPDMKGS